MLDCEAKDFWYKQTTYKKSEKNKNKFSKSRLMLDESMELYIPIKYKLCVRLIPGISIAIADTIPLINSIP